MHCVKRVQMCNLHSAIPSLRTSIFDSIPSVIRTEQPSGIPHHLDAWFIVANVIYMPLFRLASPSPSTRNSSSSRLSRTSSSTTRKPCSSKLPLLWKRIHQAVPLVLFQQCVYAYPSVHVSSFFKGHATSSW